MNYRHYQPYERRKVQRRRTDRSKRGGSFMPFLIVIAFGFVIVLFGKLVSTWFDQRDTVISNKIIAHVESGSASLIPWGRSDKQTLYDGTVVLEGDKIVVADNSYLLLGLYDGGSIRAGDSAMLEVYKNGSGELKIQLDSGRLWYFPSERQKEIETFSVITKNLVATSTGPGFDTAYVDGSAAVRVFDGDVDVVVTDSLRGKTLQNYSVGVGQEIVLSETQLEKVLSGEKARVIKAINDQYKDSTWYRKNTNDDPRLIATPEPLPETTPVPAAEGEATAPPASTPASVATSGVATPVVTSPTSPFTTDAKKVAITGTVADTVLKVQVKHLIGGKESWTTFLKRYRPGSGTWSYNAVFGEDSNLLPGENTYEIYAYDREDNVSKKAVVTINHTAPAFTAKPVASDAPATSASPAPATDEVTTPTPTTQAPSKLTTPAVTSFNSAEVFTSHEDTIKITGTVDPTSIRVFVNGFALTGYRPGDTRWTYYAAKKYETLNEGVNSFRVYSVDEEGNRSNILDFSINKVAPPTPTPEPTPES